MLPTASCGPRSSYGLDDQAGLVSWPDPVGTWPTKQMDNMEVDNHLFVEENGLPRGQAIHFHVSSRECTWRTPFFTCEQPKCDTVKTNRYSLSLVQKSFSLKSVLGRILGNLLSFPHKYSYGQIEARLKVVTNTPVPHPKRPRRKAKDQVSRNRKSVCSPPHTSQIIPGTI